MTELSITARIDAALQRHAQALEARVLGLEADLAQTRSVNRSLKATVAELQEALRAVSASYELDKLTQRLRTQ